MGLAQIALYDTPLIVENYVVTTQPHTHTQKEEEKDSFNNFKEKHI